MRFFAFCYVVALCLLALTPVSVFAKVYISEVAWMGAAENANAEWIELYNDGPVQDVTGWMLAALDGQPEIMLEGTIASGAYVVLERSTDDTVPGVSAFQIYTGAMGNTGETLELRDADGVLVDAVSGGADWELGGDNTTKDTLQRSGEPAVGGWVTGAATPGRGGGVASVNENDSAVSDERTSSNSSEVQVLKSEVVPAVKTHLRPGLTLDLGPDRTVTVGVPITFSVRTYTESGREIAVTDIDWNFGDGATAHGRDVTHRYAYTGDYVVHARGNRGGFRSDILDTAQVVVHVVEPSFVISDANEKYIEIKNTGAHDLDLSGYALAVGSQYFRVPAGTTLLSNASVRFPKSVTKLAVRSGVVAGIFYPDNTLAQTYRTAVSAPVLAAVSGQVVRTAVAAPTPTPSVGKNVPQEAVEDPSPYKEFSLPELAAAHEAYDGLTGMPTTDQDKGTLAWWFVGLAAAIVTAVSAVLLIRREQAEVIAGLEIEGDDV